MSGISIHFCWNHWDLSPRVFVTFWSLGRMSTYHEKFGFINYQLKEFHTFLHLLGEYISISWMLGDIIVYSQIISPGKYWNFVSRNFSFFFNTKISSQSYKNGGCEMEIFNFLWLSKNKIGSIKIFFCCVLTLLFLCPVGCLS